MVHHIVYMAVIAANSPFSTDFVTFVLLLSIHACCRSFRLLGTLTHLHLHMLTVCLILQNLQPFPRCVACINSRQSSKPCNFWHEGSGNGWQFLHEGWHSVGQGVLCDANWMFCVSRQCTQMQQKVNVASPTIIKLAKKLLASALYR